MVIGEIAGYIASALVFATFYMKTMLRLRIIAIVSNVAFIIYALVQGLPPILILHACLLPLNILRLREFTGLVKKTRAAARGEVSFESLIPFMTAARAKAGDVLFRRGDPSHDMLYVCEGRVTVPEIGKTVGAGETLGEIGLFAEDRTRTMSAVCDTDCELLRISEERFLQLYNQNPRFGFYIVRVITSRLIENYEQLVKAMAPRTGINEMSTGPVTSAGPMERLDEKRAMPAPPPPDKRRYGRSRAIRSAAVFLVFLLLLASAWIIGPYVESVFFRNAAVTSWANFATAPIDGTIQLTGRAPGNTVGPDGEVAVVENEHVSRAAYDKAQIAVTQKQAEVRQLENHAEELKALDIERGTIKSQYAEKFRNQLDTDIANILVEVDTANAQLKILRKIASRSALLASNGTVAQREADEAAVRVSELEVKVASMTTALKSARSRRAAADNGIFLTSAGVDPNWVFDWRMDLKVAKKTAYLDLAKARAELANSESALVAAEKDLQRLSRARVVVPGGSTIWSWRVASGSAVRAGDPIAEWIDCSTLLTVVPVTDIEMALIAKGMKANVLLDGESRPHAGTVIMTRGSASSLSRTDLVALPTGRHEQAAEVVIDISMYRDLFSECPVGRTASVDFPTVGIFDIARAWLRLQAGR